MSGLTQDGPGRWRTTISISCQDLAQKSQGLTWSEERSEATVHRARLRMGRVEPDPGEPVLGQLEPAGHGPHFLDEPHNPAAAQAGCPLGQPAPRPEQDVVGPL